MGMKVVYMAHPVAGDVEVNLERAKQWLRWIEATYDVAVVASWITECEVWDDSNPEHRAAGLKRDLAVLERCDELWLVGPRVSGGMRAEANHAVRVGVRVFDFTHAGKIYPPFSGGKLLAREYPTFGYPGYVEAD